MADVEALDAQDDAAAADALGSGQASVALLDPAYWARARTRFRPVSRSAVSVGPGGTDMWLLGAVRLDGLSHVTAPPDLAGRGEEAVARTLVRDYYGVENPLALRDTGAVGGEEGAIVFDASAMEPQNQPYVESLSRAWWLFSGYPWIRALAVERADAPPDDRAEALLKEAGRLLAQEPETVAASVSSAEGGVEEHWLELVRALSLTYAAEERKGLAALLGYAARLRMCPKLEDTLLPRY